MPKFDLNWQPSDVSFLDALLLATGGEGGAPLQDILLMADAVDGTIFTLTEVTQAIEKLTAAEVIQVQKNKLSLNSDFMRIYETVAESDEVDVLQILHTKQLTLDSINEAREVLKKYKLKNYYQQYLEQFG